MKSPCVPCVGAGEAERNGMPGPRILIVLAMPSRGRETGRTGGALATGRQDARPVRVGAGVARLSALHADDRHRLRLQIRLERFGPALGAVARVLDTANGISADGMAGRLIHGTPSSRR